MNKAIFVVLALFAIVSAEQFQTLNFNQGKLHLRSLDTTSSLKNNSFVNYTGNAAVNVNLGADYIEKAKIDTTKPTDMLIALYTSATVFSKTDLSLVTTCYSSSTSVCAEDTTTKLQMMGPNYWVTQANPFTLPVTIGSDSSNPSWQLNSKALLATTTSSNPVAYPGGSTQNYFRYSSTYPYGFIGMGVDEDSAGNFKGDHPLFSVWVNSSDSGSGELIFGKNTSLYDSSRTPQVVKTNTNWTTTTDTIYIGINKTAFTAPVNLVLDVQYPGLGLPSDQFTTIFKDKMAVGYKFETSGSYFNYNYKGNLTDLPSIIFSLSSTQNLTIPPEAYTRKVADGVYNILISPTPKVDNPNYIEGTASFSYVIFGWPVLSQFYTIFEKQANSDPTVTFYPLYGTPTSTTPTTSASSSSWKTIAIIVLVVLVALVVLSFALKKKNNLTKSDLGVELRAARV